MLVEGKSKCMTISEFKTLVPCSLHWYTLYVTTTGLQTFLTFRAHDKNNFKSRNILTLSWAAWGHWEGCTILTSRHCVMCCRVAGTAPISTCITICTTTTHLDACTICTSALPPLWWVSGWWHIRVDMHILQLCAEHVIRDCFKLISQGHGLMQHCCCTFLCLHRDTVCDVSWLFLAPMLTHNKATALCVCVCETQHSMPMHSHSPILYVCCWHSRRLAAHVHRKLCFHLC